MDKISALMDGEVEGSQAVTDLSRIRSSTELREAWETYHVIGDALRGEPLLSADFSSRLSERLAAEPTVLAPRRTLRFANIPTYALSAAAGLSAAAFVAWMALSTESPINPGTAGSSNIAATSPAPSVSNSSPVVAAADAVAGGALSEPAGREANQGPDDSKVSDFMLAHQGVSPSTALQGVAPYIRTVTATQPASR